MQHTNTEQITNTISFKHHIPLPAVSAMDCLQTAMKQLQDAITQHAVFAATTKEKAIDTLCELLAPSAKLKSPSKEAIVPVTNDHPQTNTTAPSTPNLASQEIPKQTNQHHPHIITQDDTDSDDKATIQHQYNLYARAHLIADSIIPPLVHDQHGHMCNSIIGKIMGTPLEYRQLIKQEKYRDV